MSKDRYVVTVECPNCNNKASVRITENDGWSFVSSGAQRSIGSIDGDISIEKENITCNKCLNKWVDKFFIS